MVPIKQGIEKGEGGVPSPGTLREAQARPQAERAGGRGYTTLSLFGLRYLISIIFSVCENPSAVRR